MLAQARSRSACAPHGNRSVPRHHRMGQRQSRVSVSASTAADGALVELAQGQHTSQASNSDAVLTQRARACETREEARGGTLTRNQALPLASTRRRIFSLHPARTSSRSPTFPGGTGTSSI